MPLRRIESVICNVTLWCYVAKTQSGVAFLLLTLYGFCVQQGELGRVGGGEGRPGGPAHWSSRLFWLQKWKNDTCHEQAVSTRQKWGISLDVGRDRLIIILIILGLKL